MKKKILFFFTLLLYSFTLWAQINPFTSPVYSLNALQLNTITSNPAKVLQVPHINLINNTYPVTDSNFPASLQSSTAIRGAFAYTKSIGTTQSDYHIKSLRYNDGTNWIACPPDHMGNHIMGPNTHLNMGNFNIQNIDNSISLSSDDTSLTYSTRFGLVKTFKFQDDGNIVIRNGDDIIWAKSWSTTKHSATQNIYMEGFWLINMEGHDRNRIDNKYYIHLNSSDNTPAPISIRVQNNSDVGNVFRCLTNGQLRLTNDANNIIHWQSTSDSDKRMKKNIRPMKKVLDKVLKMELVEFKYKKGMLGYSLDSLHIGVTAQDIMKIFPRYTGDLISYNSHYNRYYVSYRHLSILALEGIKEFKIQHDEKVNELKTEIDSKGEGNKVTQLKMKLKEINQRLDFLIEEIQEAQQKLYLSNKKTTDITE